MSTIIVVHVSCRLKILTGPDGAELTYLLCLVELLATCAKVCHHLVALVHWLSRIVIVAS